MKYIKTIFYMLLGLTLLLATVAHADVPNGAVSDENTNSTNVVAVGEGAYYPNGCIPNIALPVYPESQSCVAPYSVYYPQPVDQTQAEAPSTSTEQTTIAPSETATAPASQNNQTTTSPVPSSSVNTSSNTSYVYYYSSPPYYTYPSSANYLAVFATGVAIGAAYSNQYYYPYYPYHPYYPYSPYHPYNPYYPYQTHTSWHWDNGNAGYTRGPNGGAYHWNANGYSGGGYCYRGNCGHTNNWNGGNVNKNTQNNLTTHAAPTQKTPSTLSSPPKANKNVTPKNNHVTQKPTHFNQKAPVHRSLPNRESGFRHEMGGHGMRR